MVPLSSPSITGRRRENGARYQQQCRQEPTHTPPRSLNRESDGRRRVYHRLSGPDKPGHADARTTRLYDQIRTSVISYTESALTLRAFRAPSGEPRYHYTKSY
jgi:hypothetical protein